MSKCWNCETETLPAQNADMLLDGKTDIVMFCAECGAEMILRDVEEDQVEEAQKALDKAWNHLLVASPGR